MDTFTRQELVYIARALRLEAASNEREAQDPKYGTAQHIFETSAKALRALAEKADMMANKAL